MRLPTLVFLCGLLAASAEAQPPVPPPPTAHAILQIQEVHQWSKDRASVFLAADRVLYQTKPEERGVTIFQNGMAVTVKQTVNVLVPVVEKVVSQYAVKDLRATDVSGKALTPEEVARRVPAGSAVLVSPAGYRLPASHRRLFSKDAVIFVLPSPEPTKKEPR